MLTQRSLLLIMFFLFFFEPSLEKWAVSDSSNWYRPYLAWFSVIVIVFLIQRWSDKREL